jgi:hypothetical protein
LEEGQTVIGHMTLIEMPEPGQDYMPAPGGGSGRAGAGPEHRGRGDDRHRGRGRLGKSTQLNVLGWAGPTLGRPGAGDGQYLLKLSETELDRYRCQKVGFVWQQTTRNLTPYLNARENVELPMRLGDLVPVERRARAEELAGHAGWPGGRSICRGSFPAANSSVWPSPWTLANQPPLCCRRAHGEWTQPPPRKSTLCCKGVNRETGTYHCWWSRTTPVGPPGRAGGRHPRRQDLHRTVRVEPKLQARGEVIPQEFEELLMLDSAGRVQIPRECWRGSPSSGGCAWRSRARTSSCSRWTATAGLRHPNRRRRTRIFSSKRIPCRKCRLPKLCSA